MEYNGWTLYDKVTLVIKKEKHKNYNLPQGYVVNSTDKKQLERAINWGEYKKYLYDDNNEPIKDIKGYSKYEVVKPDIIELKNEEFTVSLLDFAHDSCNGGKLSFWNCLIEHEESNIKCVVGISSDLLLTLLVQNKFNYGKCEKKVIFARQSGHVGLLTKDMKEYQEALKDMQIKKNINKGKTSRWKVGHNYKTLTIDEMYFGNIYQLVGKVKNPEYKNLYTCDEPLYLEVLKNKRYNIICNTSLINADISKASELQEELIKTYTKNINDTIKKLNDKKKSYLYICRLICVNVAPLLNRNIYLDYIDTDKFPSRQAGERVIEQDILFKEAFNNVIKHMQKETLRLLKLYDIDDIRQLVEDVLIRTTPFKSDLSDLDENEKELLKYLLKNENKHKEYKIDKELKSLINKL